MRFSIAAVKSFDFFPFDAVAACQQRAVDIGLEVTSSIGLLAALDRDRIERASRVKG